MPHPLDGAKLKIVRAEEHLDSLKCEIRMFIHENPAHLRSEEDGDFWSLTPEFRIPPPLRLSTIIGDCVVNLRAALDYVVWEIARTHANPPLVPTDKGDKKLFSMPIYDHPPNIKRDDGLSQKLNGLTNRKLPAPAIKLIEDIQPCNSGYEPLLWLHELVNTDKHRTPLLTLGVVQAAEVVMTNGKWRGLVSGKSHRHGLTFKTDPAMLGALMNGTMKVDTQLAIDVTWKDLPMPDEPVERTLEKILKAVADIVPKFEAFV
jgi:hypothetical protein